MQQALCAGHSCSAASVHQGARVRCSYLGSRHPSRVNKHRAVHAISSGLSYSGTGGAGGAKPIAAGAPASLQPQVTKSFREGSICCRHHLYCHEVRGIMKCR
jgi:hypothetical protein